MDLTLAALPQPNFAGFMAADVVLAEGRLKSLVPYLYLTVLMGRATGKFWCPRLESRYLAPRRVQEGCSPTTLQCGIMAGTAGKHLRHCWSHGVHAPLSVLISPDVTRPEHHPEVAEPAQGVTRGAGLLLQG